MEISTLKPELIPPKLNNISDEEKQRRINEINQRIEKRNFQKLRLKQLREEERKSFIETEKKIQTVQLQVERNRIKEVQRIQEIRIQEERNRIIEEKQRMEIPLIHHHKVYMRHNLIPIVDPQLYEESIERYNQYYQTH